MKLRARLSESCERHKDRLLSPRSSSSLLLRKQQPLDHEIDAVALLKDVGVDAGALWNRAVAAGLEMPLTSPPKAPLAIE